MKRIIAVLLCLAAVCTTEVYAGSSKDAEQLCLADPFVYEEGGVFYIYGTSSADGIVVFKSTDLKHWEGPCGNAEGGLALHKSEAWGGYYFWAPEVYKLGDRYAMMYSAEEHLCVAYADSPLGPFRQEDGPGAYNPGRKGIDGHVFTDGDGSKYLYWVRWDRGFGNEIWCTRISDDLKTLQGDMVHCIQTIPNTWEQMQDNCKVAEGPFIVKHNGLYYLSFSCNGYTDQDYAVGYAVSDNPFGPWKRYEGNPILRRKDGEVGTGHHMFLTTSDGRNYIVYHVHSSHSQVGPRRTSIAPYKFVSKKGQDVMKIGKKVITPVF